MASSPLIRILHVVGAMNRGGSENGLMNILRHINRDRFRIDILVHTTAPAHYDDEARALGAKIIPCLSPRRPWAYARNFKHRLNEHGPYDIVHSHVAHFSGYVLRLAQQASVPVRLAHSRSSRDADARRLPGLARPFYLYLTTRWLNQHATAGLAVSEPAAAGLFGKGWENDGRWRVFYSGNDFTPYRATTDPIAVRAEFGIPPDAFVIGHVGSFRPAKNHTFLVDVFAEVIRRKPETWLLLVGEGPLHSEVAARVGTLGLDRRTVFAGIRSDVPRLMMGGMNVLVFPSLFEGLPRAVVEAQAASVPCFLSDAITPEVAVVKPLIRYLSLNQSPVTWAESILQAREPSVTQEQSLRIMEASPFNIRTQVNHLEAFYESELKQAHSEFLDHSTGA